MKFVQSSLTVTNKFGFKINMLKFTGIEGDEEDEDSIVEKTIVDRSLELNHALIS